MKKLLIACFIVITLMGVVGCQNKGNNNALTNIDNNEVNLEPSSTASEETASWSTDDKRQEFDVFLCKNGKMYDGVEMWEEGKVITFNISSEEKLALEVGLRIIIDENNFEFGEIISEPIEIEDGEGKFSITVPKAGKYAIYIKNIGDESVNFILNLDTPLSNILA